VIGVRKDLTRQMTRVKAFQVLRGQVYSGSGNWKGKHRKWVEGLTFSDAPVQRSYEHLLDGVVGLEERLRRVDDEIEALAATPRYADKVRYLCAFRGVGLVTAMVFLTELPRIERFRSPKELMAYVGLIPSEFSSGACIRQGKITKCGKSRVRRTLVEAAWNVAKWTRDSQGDIKAREGLPGWVCQRVAQARTRLHRRFWTLALRGGRKVAAVAIARELVGFLWSVTHPDGQRLHQLGLARGTSKPKPRLRRAKTPVPAT